MALPIIDEWLTTFENGIKDAAAKNNADVDVVSAEEKTEVQVSQVENFVSSGVDALIVIAVDADATDPMTEAAKAKNIPLVYVNRKPTNFPDGVGFVGSDGLKAGIEQMTALAKIKGGKGNVAILQGTPGDYNTLKRTEGCKDVVAQNPGMQVVLEASAGFYRDKGQSVTENWLQSGKQIDMICANNDEMAIGAINAIKASGKTLGADGIAVGGIDATKDALAAMQAGDLSVTMYQNGPGQAEASVEMAVEMAGGKTPASYTQDVPFELVTPENVSNFVK
ncbi:MAG: substrate-binding domain-containing protein [Actinobacteria bacterium]|nr:substrate-binding domain-containing protein [Actinomycetota bacterium]